MSVNNEHEMLEPEKELKNVGLKATAPRMRILELFQKAQESGAVRHLTAEDIYKQLVAENIEVGLATVYRVLTQFEAAGLIVRHYFGNDRATYEMDDGAHHDHIVCTRCGRVEEFVDKEIEKRQKQIAVRLGFELEGHSLALYGVCEDCRKKEKLAASRQTQKVLTIQKNGLKLNHLSPFLISVDAWTYSSTNTGSRQRCESRRQRKPHCR